MERKEGVKDILRLAMYMQESYQGLSIQDIQDEFEISRRTAHKSHATVAEKRTFASYFVIEFARCHYEYQRCHYEEPLLIFQHTEGGTVIFHECLMKNARDNRYRFAGRHVMNHDLFYELVDEYNSE